MNLQPTVLIVDDEKHTRDGLRSLLENDYDMYVAPDLAGAINVLGLNQMLTLVLRLLPSGIEVSANVNCATQLTALARRPPVSPRWGDLFA